VTATTIEKLLAATLAPLVRVAWADGGVDDEERRVLLHAAREWGVSPGTESYRLLESYLDQGVPDDLEGQWEEAIQILRKTLPRDRWEQLVAGIVELARRVAESSGEVWTLDGGVSASEELELERLIERIRSV
jgi:tellurite resistance protein